MAVLALVSVLILLVNARLLAQDQYITILMKEQSVSLDSAKLCSYDQLESGLSAYEESTPVHIENDADIDTTRIIKLMEKIREFGYEEVTATSMGEPGWSLYPIYDDFDVFECEKTRE